MSASAACYPLPWTVSDDKHDCLHSAQAALFSANIEIARSVVERCAGSLNILRTVCVRSKVTINWVPRTEM